MRRFVRMRIFKIVCSLNCIAPPRVLEAMTVVLRWPDVKMLTNIIRGAADVFSGECFKNLGDVATAIKQGAV
jgi:hypothetical protein